MPPDREELEARIAECDQLLAADDGSNDPEAQLTVARTLRRKGQALLRLGRNDDSARCFDEIASRFVDTDQPELHTVVAYALGEGGLALGRAGRFPEADRHFADLLERYGQSDDLPTDTVIARGLYNRAFFLARDELRAEALEAIATFLHRYADKPPAERPDLPVDTLTLKLRSLWNLGRIDEAIVIGRALVEHYGEESDTVVRLAVIKALLAEAELAKQSDRSDLALACYDDILTRFADSTDGDVRARVADAFSDKAVLLWERKHDQAAIDVCDELILRYGTDPPDRRPLIACGAMYLSCCALQRLGRVEQAGALAQRLIERYGKDDDVYARDVVCRALGLQSNIARDAGRDEEALRLRTEELARLRGATEPKLRTRWATTQAYVVWLLLRLERVDEAIAASDELIARFAVERDDPETAREVGTALLDAGEYFQAKGFKQLLGFTRAPVQIYRRRRRRSLQALAIFELVAARFGDATDPALQALALEARFHVGITLVLPHLPSSPTRQLELITAHGKASNPALDAWLQRWEGRSGSRPAALQLLRALIRDDSDAAEDDKRAGFAMVAAQLAGERRLLIRLIAAVARSYAKRG